MSQPWMSVSMELDFYFVDSSLRSQKFDIVFSFSIVIGMASKTGFGGPRVASGRRLDPVRNHFVTINSTENMGKPLGQQLVRCKRCMTCLRGKIERLTDHLKRCSAKSGTQNNVMNRQLACLIEFVTVLLFLDASLHLYQRVCPSVSPSVRPSVGP